MFPCASYVWNKPDYGQCDNVTISPNGEPAPVLPPGEVNLYPQASQFFGQLRVSNVFTAPLNTFQDVCARRIRVTSDRNQKENLQPIPDAEGTALVRQTVPYRYTIDGQVAAGLLADEVPAQYAGGDPAARSVDYNSLLAELWAAVRDAHERLDALEQHVTRHRDDSSGSGDVESSEIRT